MKVNQIFEGNNMEYSYFPGGYFDSAGAVHYTHTDYQGSIIAVTDSLGKVVQTVGYYPYGEPWREPSGQPMLFAGKERTPQADYLFGPRTYNPAALVWHASDRKASSFTQWSPYSYCGGNPIFLIDKNGLEPTLYESALMSLCAYQDDQFNGSLEKLKRRDWFISEKQANIRFNCTGLLGNGFQSVLFEKRIGGEVAEYAYAIAGTNDVKDVIEDGLQLVGLSSQYAMAVKNTEALLDDNDIKQKGLTTVGHSLGAGCAAAASMATGCSAITFNAASVSAGTKVLLGLKKSGNITNVISSVNTILGINVIVDPLTITQDLRGIPAQGERNYLSIQLNGINSTHSIQSIIDAIKK